MSKSTKNLLIIPFIQRVLGYNAFDNDDFVPEYKVNVENTNNLKLNYTILQSGKPVILVKCKCYGKNLEDNQERHQLFHSFMVTNALIGIITNGIIYKFYADLDKKIKWMKFHF